MREIVKRISTIPIRILATVIYTIILPLAILLEIVYGMDNVIDTVLENYSIIWEE